MNESRRRIVAIAVSGLFATLAAPTALAQATPDKPAAKSEPIYGYRMMTPEERDAYRAKMRNAPGAEERQRIRDEHHAAMVERARERGITLPDQPTGAGPRGPGMGPGQGMGPGAGMGPGQGMGPGGPGPRGGMGPGRMGPPDGPRGPGAGAGTQ